MTTATLPPQRKNERVLAEQVSDGVLTASAERPRRPRPPIPGPTWRCGGNSVAPTSAESSPTAAGTDARGPEAHAEIE